MLWYLKQIVPLTYWSCYTDGRGRKIVCVWKMWLGKCYKIRTWEVSRDLGDDIV